MGTCVELSWRRSNLFTSQKRTVWKKEAPSVGPESTAGHNTPHPHPNSALWFPQTSLPLLLSSKPSWRSLPELNVQILVPLNLDQMSPSPPFPDLSPLNSSCIFPVPLSGNLHADCVTITSAHMYSPLGDAADCTGL